MGVVEDAGAHVARTRHLCILLLDVLLCYFCEQRRAPAAVRVVVDLNRFRSVCVASFQLRCDCLLARGPLLGRLAGADRVIIWIHVRTDVAGPSSILLQAEYAFALTAAARLRFECRVLQLSATQLSNGAQRQINLGWRLFCHFLRILWRLARKLEHVSRRHRAAPIQGAVSS